MERMAEQGLRHGEGEPSGLMDQKEQKVDDEESEGQPHEGVLNGFARSGAQDEFRQPVEEVEYDVHVPGAAPHQISQAASAWCCNMDKPSNVLAPNAEARCSSCVSRGL